jgi:hypothetical protein
VADLLSAFLDTPNADTYLALRAALIHSPDYDAASGALTDFTELVKAGDHEAVRAAIPSLMAQFLVSPQAHMLLATSAKNAGDSAMQKREEVMAMACLHGIADTGDGSAEAPYRCVHVSDQYDLANAKGLTVTGQTSDVQDGRFHDILFCDDSSEMHFDMTEILAVMADE